MLTLLPIFPTAVWELKWTFLLDLLAVEKSNAPRTKACREDAAGKHKSPVSYLACPSTEELPILPINIAHYSETPVKSLKG